MTASTVNFSTNIVLPQSSDATEPNARSDINYLIFAARTLALALDSYTGAISPPTTDWPNLVVGAAKSVSPYRFYALAIENISTGAFVNFSQKNATSVYAAPAQANGAANVAGGFCITPGGVIAGNYGEFIIGPGVNTYLSGLIPGNWYWLSPTSTTGQVQAARPTVAGQIDQNCGLAITNTMLMVGALNNWKVI